MKSLRTLSEVARDIRSIRIQGARRIARAALEALVSTAQKSKAKTKNELYQQLLSAAKTLESTRPTEPMMRNSLEDSLRFILAWTRTRPSKDVKDMKSALLSHHSSFIDKMHESINKIAKFGSAEIPHGANILIHCHSTTIIKILQKAYDEGKNPHVTCLETRPLYQGRLSARELSEYGLEVNLTVDSASGSLISKMDLVLVGADAITAEGDLINKIGTFTLAQLAHTHSIRFLCAAEIYKYDPLTRFGRAGPIEERGVSEVWGSGLYAKEKAGKNSISIPKKLKVLNPAFDRTPANFISAYITEEGLIPPAQLAILAEKKLEIGE
ncbi:MAG: S-methyl-5-thioribose-1-phosphate isomerase [Candidatus Micrarchaeota archaeon]